MQRKVVNIPASAHTSDLKQFAAKHGRISSAPQSHVGNFDQSEFDVLGFLAGREGANTLDARRLQTERLENNSTCRSLWRTSTGSFYWCYYIAHSEKLGSHTEAQVSTLNSQITPLFISWSVHFKGKQR